MGIAYEILVVIQQTYAKNEAQIKIGKAIKQLKD